MWQFQVRDMNLPDNKTSQNLLGTSAQLHIISELSIVFNIYNIAHTIY